MVTVLKDDPDGSKGGELGDLEIERLRDLAGKEDSFVEFNGRKYFVKVRTQGGEAEGFDDATVVTCDVTVTGDVAGFSFMYMPGSGAISILPFGRERPDKAFVKRFLRECVTVDRNEFIEDSEVVKLSNLMEDIKLVQNKDPVSPCVVVTYADSEYKVSFMNFRNEIAFDVIKNGSKLFSFSLDKGDMKKVVQMRNIDLAGLKAFINGFEKGKGVVRTITDGTKGGADKVV